MKNIILILLLSASGLFAQADYSTLLLLTTAHECATSDTAEPHDTLLEGFQVATTGYENTWMAGGIDVGVTFNPAADTTSLTTGKPAGACNQALRVTVAMSDGNEESIYWDAAVGNIDVDTVSMDFYCYLYFLTPPDGAEDLTIICGKNATNPTSASGSSFQLLVKASGGVPVLFARGATDSGDKTLSLNTWHKVKIHIDTTHANSSISVDDDTPSTFTRRTSVDPRYLHIGSADAATAGDSADFYIDLVAINTP